MSQEILNRWRKDTLSVREDLPELTSIYFYLTEGCNLKCRHCWLAPKFDEKVKCPTLPVNLFQTAIKEAKPLGLQSVKLTGGEPLMHPMFTDLLKIVRHENIGLTIETNGMLCTPDVAEEIGKAPHSSVSVSIDGADAATHEWMRGVSGCFERSKQAVRNLVNAGIETEIIMSLTRRNADQIEDVIRMAEDLGALSVKFNIVQPTARGESFIKKGESLSVEDLIRLGHYNEEVIAKTTDLKLFFDYPNAFRSLSRIAKHDCGECAILNIIGVIASGYYALCGIGEHIKELVFGKVGEDSLDGVWMESVILKSLREGLLGNLEGVCKQCILKKSCLGRCVAQNYYTGKTLWSPFWFCDEAYRKGLFPSTRLCDIPGRQSVKTNEILTRG